ncbi:HesA/MoeB/ThiF family protein, partial [Candidatus Bathyarchaeota archaeon]|nr:HesA/MoeB/ThiF family protein [Candidatus Bathyarchaeota archaeon]
MSLSQQELERYSRQIIMNKWGKEGQIKLKNSAVAVVGLGGLGSISSTLLAAVGVGKLVLIDGDKLSLSDLNRQILYSSKDIGKFKVEIAKERLTALNPEVEISAINKEITVDKVSSIVGKVDIVVDGLDNWKTRFTVNDYCVKSRIPFVHAGVSQFYGQITSVLPGKGPCLRCIFPKEPTETEVNPIFSGTPSALASLQVMEAVKCLMGIGKLLVGRMLFIDEYRI